MTISSKRKLRENVRLAFLALTLSVVWVALSGLVGAYLAQVH